MMPFRMQINKNVNTTVQIFRFLTKFYEISRRKEKMAFQSIFFDK